MRADRRVVHSSMSRVRPRPTLEDVSRWQDRARDLVPPGPTVTEPGWDQVAAFVVSYEESGSDRRVVVAQAEHVAPEPITVLDGWEVNSEATAWMMGHVAAAQADTPQTDTPAAEDAPPTPEPSPSPDGPRARVAPPPLQFRDVRVGSATGGTVTVDPAGAPSTVASPQWVELDVAGPGPSVPVQVADPDAVRSGRPHRRPAERPGHGATPRGWRSGPTQPGPAALRSKPGGAGGLDRARRGQPLHPGAADPAVALTELAAHDGHEPLRPRAPGTSPPTTGRAVPGGSSGRRRPGPTPR